MCFFVFSESVQQTHAFSQLPETVVLASHAEHEHVKHDQAREKTLLANGRVQEVIERMPLTCRSEQCERHHAGQQRAENSGVPFSLRRFRHHIFVLGIIDRGTSQQSGEVEHVRVVVEKRRQGGDGT